MTPHRNIGPWFFGELETAVTTINGKQCATIYSREDYDAAEELRTLARDLAAALEGAQTQVRDLANGWPVRELHEDPNETRRKVRRLLTRARALGVAP